MFRILLLLSLVVPSYGAMARAQAWEPERTWTVVSGVVTWSDPELEPFSGRHRKDRELFEVLGERGVPAAQRILLLDREATANATRAALLAQVVAAPTGSTFVFYFQGHGLHDDAQRFVMATSDTRTEQLGETGLQLGSLFPIFALRGPRDRVLLLGDACSSGALGALAAALTFMGVPTIALTSADARSESSENWTFTQAFIDALRGRTLVDRDGDGRIRLSEVAEEARLAMRYREGQPIGFMAPSRAWQDLELGAPLPLAHPLNGPDLELLAPRGAVFGRGDWVIATRLDGSRSAARVLGAQREEDKPTRLRVEYYDYSDRHFGWAREDRVDPIVFERWPVGMRLQVEDDEEVHEAEVLVSDDGLHLVRYLGYDASEDEYVTPDQILGPSDPRNERPRVLVEERGDSYEAVVKGRFGALVCVRYRGSSWLEDQCVPETRISPDPRDARPDKETIP